LAARFASIFSGDEAIDVYQWISGFTERIQEEILKRSDGDPSRIDALVGSKKSAVARRRFRW
jgi:hypothetical protein